MEIVRSASIARLCHAHRGAIPAWVFTQCGEPFFEAREVEQIHRALEALDKANERLAPAV